MKRHQKLTPEGRAFVARIREFEQRLFPELLDPDDSHRMLSARYSWHYRPSHHAGRGLLSASELTTLSVPGCRILSVGAYPACFEQLLCTLGLPPGNLVVADKDPAIATCLGTMEKVVFDVLDPWPELGRFDLILFPESLCIALSDRVSREVRDPDDIVSGPFPNDRLEGQLLAHVLLQALERLRIGGMIRANGPMSHPNIVRAASGLLDVAGRHHHIDYDRFFLRVCASEQPSETRFT